MTVCSLPDPYGFVCRLLASTGLRWGEAVRAQAADIQHGVLVVHQTKFLLATVIVGDDPASKIYVANKHRACGEAGMRSVHHDLPSDATEAELLDLVAALGADQDVDGILVQIPLPEQIDPDTVVAEIDPTKDVDGLTPRECGPARTRDAGLVSCTRCWSVHAPA